MNPTVCFKLFGAVEYRFYNRMGRETILLKKGDVLPVTVPTDVAYFRSRRDLLVECDAEGRTADDLSMVNGVNTKKAKTFQVYGRAPNQPALVTSPAIPPTLSPAPQPVRQSVGQQPTIRVGIPAVAPVGGKAPRPLTGNESPIEVLAPDGSTAQSIALG